MAGASQGLCARQKTATKEHQWQELDCTVSKSAPDSCGEFADRQRANASNPRIINDHLKSLAKLCAATDLSSERLPMSMKRALLWGSHLGHVLLLAGENKTESSSMASAISLQHWKRSRRMALPSHHTLLVKEVPLYKKARSSLYETQY